MADFRYSCKHGPVLQYSPSSQTCILEAASQHINEGGVESFTLAIHLGVVWTGSEFLCPH